MPGCASNPFQSFSFTLLSTLKGWRRSHTSHTADHRSGHAVCHVVKARLCYWQWIVLRSYICYVLQRRLTGADGGIKSSLIGQVKGEAFFLNDCKDSVRLKRQWWLSYHQGWSVFCGSLFEEQSWYSSPIHADFLVNSGRSRPCPPCPQEAPALPPSVDLRNVLFSTSAWMFATWLPPQWKKRRAECVSEVSGMGSRFASCFRNLLEDRRQTSNNQNTCFQTTSVFRLRSDESRDLDWDQRWFSVQTYFRGVCWYVWKQLSFYFRMHISSPWED